MSVKEEASLSAAAAEPDEESIAAMFDASKKKKKKRAAKEEPAEEMSAGTVSSAATPLIAPPAGEELSSRSVAPAGASEESHGAASASSASSSVLTVTGDEPLTYDAMLSLLYKTLHENNPELTDRQRKKLKPPSVMRVGTTRTAWVNFKEICDALKRSQEHVQSFYLAELGTTGSIDGSDRFLIKGKYTPKTVELLLRKYIMEYVTCHMCKSLETELTKDAVSRLFFLSCKQCGSQRSVVAIKAGFHATGKGERKKAREAAPG